MGERIARELNGVSCLELEEAPTPQKGIATARSFGHPIETIDGLEQALAAYTARAAEKLRAGGQVAGRIQVHLETSPFAPGEKITRLHNPLGGIATRKGVRSKQL